MAVDPVTEPVPVAVRPRSKSLAYLWLPLVGLSMIGIYAAVLIPAFAGKPGQQQDGPRVLVGSIVFFSLLWRYRQRRVWVGALIGCGAAYLVMFTVGYVIAMKHLH